MAKRPDNRPLPFRTEDDTPRARSAPPRLAHLLSGVREEPRSYYSLQEKRRLVRDHRYPPYQPMYDLLARACGGRGHSITSLARASGVKAETVSIVLRGHREPLFFTGMRLARALGIDPAELDRYLERVAFHPLK